MRAVPPMKAVMTPFPYWVGIDEPLCRAHAIMRDHSIRHLPVMQAGTLVSVITDKELASVAAASVDGLSVKDVCRTGPYVVGLSEPLDRVLLHMAEHHLDSVVVVKEGRLAGIFTVSDACRHFGRLLQSLFPPGGDDAA